MPKKKVKTTSLINFKNKKTFIILLAQLLYNDLEDKEKILIFLTSITENNISNISLNLLHPLIILIYKTNLLNLSDFILNFIIVNRYSKFYMILIVILEDLKNTQ